MKMYVNGVLAGTTTGVNAAFVMPSGLGLLGDDGGGGELMFGTIYRVTAYTSLLTDAAILSHGKAFANLMVTPPAPSQPGLWVSAYYAAWMQGSAPAANIDFTTATHFIHFAAVPNSDGSLNLSTDSLTAANSADVVKRGPRRREKSAPVRGRRRHQLSIHNQLRHLRHTGQQPGEPHDRARL